MTLTYGRSRSGTRVIKKTNKYPYNESLLHYKIPYMFVQNDGKERKPLFYFLYTNPIKTSSIL
jgi:hypothetical protein